MASGHQEWLVLSVRLCYNVTLEQHMCAACAKHLWAAVAWVGAKKWVMAEAPSTGVEWKSVAQSARRTQGRESVVRLRMGVHAPAL